MKTYIGLLLVALGWCLYRLHEDTLVMQYQAVLIQECKALLSQPADRNNNLALRSF